MAQLERSMQPAGEGVVGRAHPVRAAGGVPVRAWTPKITILGALATGGLLAYRLPTVNLSGGGTLDLSQVTSKLTAAGENWVLTLAWMAGIIAMIATVVFPASERFIQTVAITLGSLVALVLPLYISQHFDLIDQQASSLGSGMIAMIVAFAAAAVLPWLNVLVFNRTRPVFGRNWSKWVFLLPAVIWIVLLTVFPLAYAITTSRYTYRNGRIGKFVGWDNYKKMFAVDDGGKVFWTAIGLALVVAAAVLAVGLALRWLSDRSVDRLDAREVANLIPIVTVPVVLVYLARHILKDPLGTQFNITLIFVVGAVTTEMILGFLLALLLNREIRGRAGLRTVLTLPIFATPVAIGYLGRTIFYEGDGPVNSLLKSVGVTPPPWLSDPTWSKVTTIIADVWQWTPFVFIIALAGLQGLPQDVVEAAEVDGATAFQVFRYITLPLMAPILWLILLLRTIDAFKVFDIAYAMTVGGPGRATEYYSLFNYRTARQFFNYGEAAAQAFLLLFIVMLLVSLLWGRIRHVYEEDQGVRV